MQSKQIDDRIQSQWLFPRIWAGFLLLLLAVTYPLWFSIGEYPQVSNFNLGTLGSSAVSVALIASLLLIVIKPRPMTQTWWIVAGLLLVSFLLDQHRLQPWAYQSAIYAVAFASLRPTIARTWLILLAASIYIYSAVGKLDYQFVHTVGQDFLTALASPIGGRPESIELETRAKIALMFPIGELAIGLGLLLPPTRPFAAPMAMLMHGLLLAILGPPISGVPTLGFQGLGHSSGVLVWNVALMLQAYFLVIRPAPAGGDPASSRFSILAYGAILIALFAPMSERYGYWDHWTSWAVYSPHNSRTVIQIHESAVTRLPAEVQLFLDRDEDKDSWRELDTGRWSLKVRRVPVYPQARYQLNLAAKVANQYDLQDAIRVQRQSASDRWTGQRQESRLIGQNEIEKALQSRGQARK